MKLEVVGSAAREVGFDPQRSDLDFLVEVEAGRLAAMLNESSTFARVSLESSEGPSIS